MENKYLIKFGFSQYETVYAKNKEEAKQKYIERMKQVMPKYGLTFDDNDIKDIKIISA